MRLKKNSTVLLQGDSITDSNRDRSRLDSYGYGYAQIIAGWIGYRFSAGHVTVINKGISGNRVIDLRNRWKEDCLDLNPSLVSILIGINDTWRRYDSNSITTPADFERDYDYILAQVRDVLHADIILMEPFLLNVKQEHETWRKEDLEPKKEIVKKLANKYKAVHIPLDRLFADAQRKREPSFWSKDGIHPEAPGHALIAQHWLKAVGLI
jgi:lysophospholipase L1-like esterase